MVFYNKRENMTVLSIHNNKISIYFISFFVLFISFIGIIQYKKQQDNYRDYRPRFYIGESNIEGKGVFAAYDIIPHTKIGIGFYERLSHDGKKYGIINENFGAYINHCKNSNTYLRKELDIWWIVSARNIFKGEEVTANYWDTPDYIDKPSPAFTDIC